MVTELRDFKEDGLQDSKNGINEYDSSTDDKKPEKDEPMDDNDTETETEAREEDHFEEESEDEDIVLGDNHIQPGPFRNVDSIVCLGTEPDKAMVCFLKF